MSIRSDARDTFRTRVKDLLKELRVQVGGIELAALSDESRAIALTKTKLEEAEMWFERAFKDE